MMKKISLDESLARFTAVDGFSTKRTTKSDQTCGIVSRKTNLWLNDQKSL